MSDRSITVLDYNPDDQEWFISTYSDHEEFFGEDSLFFFRPEDIAPIKFEDIYDRLKDMYGDDDNFEDEADKFISIVKENYIVYMYTMDESEGYFAIPAEQHDEFLHECDVHWASSEFGN